VRENLREALRLLKEAGYDVPRAASWLMPGAERSSRSSCWARIRALSDVMLFFQAVAGAVGIGRQRGTIDPTQYETGFAAGISMW